eukprot:6183232-Pyramimonas_sp.AAC.1
MGAVWKRMETDGVRVEEQKEAPFRSLRLTTRPPPTRRGWAVPRRGKDKYGRTLPSPEQNEHDIMIRLAQDTF